jgi:small subunit ribosomal protein S5
MAFRNNNIEEKEFSEYLVALNRVSKTVKGGRVARFAAIMVVGDGHGRVGVGLGKAVEVPEAIRKGIEDAKKNMVSVSLKGTTIPHEVVGVFGAGKVLLKPAAPGTGIIAGNKVRMVLEAAGISNIRAKCLRSNNPINVVKATMAGLMQLRTAEEVAATRGITVDDVKGGVQK